MKDLAKQHLRQQAEQAQVSPVVPEEALDSGNYSVVDSRLSSDPSFFSSF